MLQSNFHQIRYATEKNPHLAEIEKKNPQIFENWKFPTELKADEIVSSDTVKVVSVEKSVAEVLKQAIENRHLSLELQGIHFPILCACIGQWDSLEKPLELITAQLVPLSNRPLNADEIQQKQQLQLQKSILEVIQDASGLEKKLNVLIGIKIKGFDQILSPFYRDLNDLIKLLYSAEPAGAEIYSVIDSDDPNHILLMGSEVLNSC